MTPAAPDPVQTAAAQSGANRDAAISGALINNIDQNTPFGNVSYEQTGFNTYTDANGKTVKVPKFTSTQTLSPEQQALYQKQTEAGANLGDLAVSQTQRLNTVLNEPFSFDGTDRDAVRANMLSRVEEDATRDRGALENKLVNQGLAPGSEAWNDAISLHQRGLTDARTQATLASGQEEARALQEALAIRNQPINEIGALLGSGQVTVPQFSGPYQQGVGTTDVAGIIGDDYNRRASQASAFNSGLFGMGSSALTGLFALSDERAKKDIEPVGETYGGNKLYKFRYRGENDNSPKRIGVMAQEVMEKQPEAVARTRTGLFAVNMDAVA